jgi:hypothetical protein
VQTSNAISVNGSASAQPSSSNSTLKDFRAWLGSLPSDTTFCGGFRTQTCPVAQFLGRPASHGDASLPEWATAFMTRYDSNCSTSLAEALAVTEALLSETRQS